MTTLEKMIEPALAKATQGLQVKPGIYMNGRAYRVTKESLSEAEKARRLNAGEYMFDPKFIAAGTHGWSTEAWVLYIDRFGSWLEPDPDMHG